ncbi:MAG: heparinase II/III-family protein [Planctomycetota bacterium]
MDLKKIYSLRGPVLAWLETRVGQWGAYIDQMSSRQGLYPLFGDSARGVAATVPQLVKYAGIPVLGTLPRAFDLAGILGLETADWYAVMNGAEPAPVYNPGHAHSDMLSFELYFRGRPVIVDIGVYGYEDNPYRWQERSTRAHNTVMVDDREIHEVWGTFRVGRRSRGITSADTAKMRVSAGYNGRANTVKRTMAVQDDIVTITDEFIFMPRHRFVTRFHFAPGLKVTPGEHACAFEGNGIQGDLTGPPNAVTYIEEYACIREFGKRAAGQCVVVSGTSAGQEYGIMCKENE